MKTKFDVQIHAYNSDNDRLLKMIALHNEGTTAIDYAVFQAYAIANNAQYISPSLKICIIEDNGNLSIIIGNKHVLTITEKVIVGEIISDGLSVHESDLLLQEKLS
jgi:hypothetical protein